ncbi:MAG TPA: M55 family metallopeptidase [Anaerolineales bacterium]|nr:M55 family metallopeptidase [Anaerolineales bacterium]
MKILIAADMEGITGVVNWDQVMPGSPDYPRFRQIMTGDVNAAIRGAFEAGASEVIVADGHNNSRNILIEELDPRARLNTGTPAPLSMVAGVDSGVSGVLMVGYHARSGAQNAILDHTWSDERVANLWINERLFGETGLNAGVCGHFDVPVLMISGDQTVCAEAVDFLGQVETAVVKQATSRMTAECLPPAQAQKLIQEAANKAVRRLQAGNAPAPFKVRAPINMVVELVQSEMADKAMTMPGARRLQDRKVSYTAQDMVTIYAAFRTLLALARK